MSTTEHRPAAPASTPQQVTPFRMPTRAAEPSFTDERTGRLPVVEPGSRRVRPGRPHRAQAGELAALAFATPLPIPAQRGPSED
jgi:hypothetical protein